MIGSVKTPLSLVSAIPYRFGYSIDSYFAEQNFSRSSAIVCVVNDTPVMRSEWGRVIEHGETLNFFLVPRGDNFKAILAVVAQIAVTIAVTALTQNPALGAAAGAAVGAVFSLVLAPKTGGTQETASPTYSLEAQGNAARLLNPIPKGYGRHNIYPDFAAQPYTTFLGNDQYLYQLFCLGLGRYTVDEVRIGDTAVWTSIGGITDSFEDVEIEIAPPGTKVSLFPAAVQTSSEVGGADMLANTKLGPYVVNSAGTVINQVAFDFVFAAGLFDANDKGKLKDRTVQVRNEIRLIDDAGAPLGPWQVVGTPSYTRATATAQRFTESYNVSDGRYQAQTTRLTADVVNDTTIQDKITWVGLRGFVPSNNIYPGVTIMAVKIRATNQLSQQSSRQFNTVQTAIIPVWDGQQWIDKPSRSIAWAAADMLRNTEYGEGRPDKLIDITKLFELDQLWAKRGDTFNGVFDTKRTFWESIGLVLAAGRTQPMLVAGVCTFMRDQPQTLANGVFTPHNIRAGTFETEHVLYNESTADDIIVEYQDERTWKPNEVQCVLEGSQSDNPIRVNMFGVTDYAQAWREGMYQAACNMYRRITGSLTSEMEGKLLMRGNVVLVSHDMPKWGSFGEVDDYDPDTRTVTLSADCEWNTGPFYLIFSDRRGRQWGPVTVTRGEWDNEAIFDAANLAEIEIDQGEFETIVTLDVNKIATRYTFGTAVKFAKRFKVTAIEPRGLDSVDVSLVNDDPLVHTADMGFPPAEDGIAGPGTNPSAPKVLSAYVTPDPQNTDTLGSYTVAWQVSGGASSYVVQISYDGSSWDTIYEGANTNATFIAQANNLTIRVAAIGSVRGEWFYLKQDFTPVA